MSTLIRSLIQRNLNDLCELTRCDQRFVDTCFSQDVLRTQEYDELLHHNPSGSYAKSSKFYNILSRKSKPDLVKVLGIFKLQETGQSDELISILEAILEAIGDNWSVEDSKRFDIHGSPDRLKLFSAIPDFSHWTKVELTYVEVEFSVLLDSLSQCRSLRSLILDPISLIGNSGTEVGQHPPLSLPQLEEFKFDLLGNASRPNKTKIQSLMNLMMKSSSYESEKQLFKSNLFFNKKEDWKIEEILNLQTNVEVSLAREVSFCVEHESGTIISTLDFTDEILESAQDGFDLRKLALRNFEANRLLTSVVDLANLTHLNLYRITLPQGVVPRCSNLQNLSIWKCTPVGMTFKLSDFSTYMKRLTLAQVRLEHCTCAPLNNLELLYFDQCEMDRDILTNFSGIFNSKVVSINPFKENCSSVQMHPLLKNILTNSKTTSVRMWMLRKFEHNCEPQHFVEIEQFLNSLNLRSGRRGDRFCGDERFILKKVNDKWDKGKTLSRSARDELYYDFFGGPDFWKSFEVYNQMC